ncbi:serine/arginine repetitive matrix protein 4 [Varanus komodoensis]|uniref:serine/arginine repetitive matrix protein 4 n=1 Tax=Varanus komodoensis TaxID=61221 RepID=UPI001CF7C73A|nr:serine/arginine repetitive matrix protein 4 [Varanus komodoensis]
MASVQQGEKQLFEKFWQGTFRAVATPRPGSVIVASITSRKPLASTEAPSCPTLPPEGKHSGGLHSVQETSGTNGCVKLKGNQEHVRQKSHSPDNHWDVSPKSFSKVQFGLTVLVVDNQNRNATVTVTAGQARRAPILSRRAMGAGSKEGHRSNAKVKVGIHSRRQLLLAVTVLGLLGQQRAVSKVPGVSPAHPTITKISKSGSSADLFKKAEGRVAKTNGEPREYDSGNDTSSPPSTQTSTSGSKGRQEASCPIHDGFDHACSSGKTSSGSGSDSGNSFTSCFSQTKGATLEDPAASPHVPGKGRRSYSRSPSHSPKSCKRSPGSRSSRQRRSPSYSRYSPSSRDRAQDHKYGSSGKDSHRHHDRRRRKQSYSPMRKRRRDSPSHLEARRITSARKRPIPYYRPSPSSSSPSSISSYSSWYSSFSHSPSRSRSHSRSPSSGRTCRSWSSSSSGGSSHSSAPRHSRRSRSGSSSSTGSDDSLRR